MRSPKVHYISGAWCTGRFWQKFFNTIEPKEVTCKRCIKNNHLHKNYWYFITINECPVCGKREEFRERRYTPKPLLDLERYAYHSVYDWCLDWGY